MNFKLLAILRNLYGLLIKAPFFFYSAFNLPFKYFLLCGEFVKLYPKGQIAQGLFLGWFEKNETVLVQKLLKPGMTVFDAGANIGLYSLIAAKIVGSKGKVFSFEPSKETFQRLQSNILLNKQLNIFPINMGLGDKVDQKLVLRQDKGQLDAERYIFLANVAAENKMTNLSSPTFEEEILIDTLENFCFVNNINKVDFIKIDTEGFEYYILLGAKNILINNPSLIILMECTELGASRASTSQKQIFEYLKSLGLNIFYWNNKINDFSEDEGIYTAGDVWVCRNKSQLAF